MSEPSMRGVTPGQGALAGMVGVLVALATTEFLAGLIGGVPSAIVAIGGSFIERVPGVVERTAISIFGKSDKLALNIGIVAVALAVGAGAGVAERSRRGTLRLVFAAFGVLGWLAALETAGVSTVRTALVIAVGVVGGILTLRHLVRVADTGAGAPEETYDHERRSFLTWSAGLAAVAVIGLATGRFLIQRTAATPVRDVTLPPPRDPVAAPPPPAAFDELEGLTPIVVPNDRFFRIDTRLTVPSLDPETWRLTITGMVDQEVELTYDDVLAMPLVERYVTIACVSNEVGGGLVGNAAWTGVPLAEVLDLAGVQDGATQIVGRAFDGWTAGFPTEAAFDDRGSLLAVGMNGEPLPNEHGFPARLVVPGLYGYVSATKWLTEIELTTWEAFDAYWVPRGWAKEGPIKTQSRIDVPRPGRVDAGEQTIAGVAWAPNVGIAEVQVRIDGGSWEAAELTEPLSDDAWRQWRHRWTAEPGEHTIQVRATDSTGQTQAEVRQRPFPDGATGWHTVEVSVS